MDVRSLSICQTGCSGWTNAWRAWTAISGGGGDAMERITSLKDGQEIDVITGVTCE